MRAHFHGIVRWQLRAHFYGIAHWQLRAHFYGTAHWQLRADEFTHRSACRPLQVRTTMRIPPAVSDSHVAPR